MALDTPNQTLHKYVPPPPFGIMKKHAIGGLPRHVTFVAFATSALPVNSGCDLVRILVRHVLVYVTLEEAQITGL